MPHVTIEYMIMIPMLILQIFLFPLTAAWIMNTWTTSRQTLALQDAASLIGSSVQQIYFSLDHETIAEGTLVSQLSAPKFIEDKPYTGNATIRAVTDSYSNASKALQITLKLTGSEITATTMVTLGQNAEWRSSTFMSNATNTCIKAQKLANGTIMLSFGTNR